MRTRTILYAILIFLIAAVALFAQLEAQRIIPVRSLPTTIEIDGRTWHNVGAGRAVLQGYRIMRPMPDTPEGKRVASVRWVQDETDRAYCVADVTYEDLPPEPVIVDVPVEDITFRFTEDGQFVGMVWVETNRVER